MNPLLAGLIGAILGGSVCTLVTFLLIGESRQQDREWQEQVQARLDWMGQ